MVPWMIWVAIGIICLIIEIFTPGFLFMSFGIGAIITGVLVWMTDVSIPLQILIFAIITFIVFLFTRKISKRLISDESVPTNVDALKGKQGTVVKEIPVDGRGYVKVGGEEWSAISSKNEKIKIGKKVIIQKIEGNKLIVAEADKKEE
ncbi:MAG: NfeD family protein [Candidatus Cloacimonadales bacterium]|nr:NfeD family protein [Candidatus Cloacimonadales bacterium]